MGLKESMVIVYGALLQHMDDVDAICELESEGQNELR